MAGRNITLIPVENVLGVVANGFKGGHGHPQQWQVGKEHPYMIGISVEKVLGGVDNGFKGGHGHPQHWQVPVP